LDWTGGQTIGTFAPAYPANPITFSAGSATVAVTLFKAGAQTLSMADHTDPTYNGTTGSLTVAPGKSKLGFATSTVAGSAVTCSSTTAINTGGNNTVFTTRLTVSASDTWGNATTLPASGTISITLSLGGNAVGEFNAIANSPQTITLPATTSGGGAAYTMARSDGSGFTGGTLTGTDSGNLYAPAVCALSAS
jgi:hypothetical protein